MSETTQEYRSDVFVQLLKENANTDEMIQFVSIIENNKFNAGLSIVDAARQIENRKLKDLISFFYERYDQGIQHLIMYKAKEDIFKLKEEAAYMKLGYMEKAVSAFEELNHYEKKAVNYFVKKNSARNSYDSVEKVNFMVKHAEDITNKLSVFSNIYEHLNEQDKFNFYLEVFLKVDWLKSLEQYFANQEEQESKKIAVFEERFDSLTDKEKYKVFNLGWLNKNQSGITASVEVNALIKELREMNSASRIKIYDSKMKNMSSREAISMTDLRDVENENAMKFLRRLDVLDYDTKSALVFLVLNEPSRKDLKRPVIVELLKEYNALSRNQQAAIMSSILDEGARNELRKTHELLVDFKGAFFDKVKLKLLSNKEISHTNFMAVSLINLNSPLLDKFNTFLISDLLVNSDNIETVKFLTKNNRSFNKPEVLERMLTVAESEKKENIANYIKENFAEKIKLSDSHNEEIWLPNKDKILGKLNKEKDAPKDPQNVKNLKVK